MDFKQINEILTDLSVIRRDTKKYKKISTEEIYKIRNQYGDGEQGAEGQSFEIYSTPMDGVFVKLDVRTDSYGDNEFVHGLTFVKPKEQIVQIFEPIT